ncbi:M48 family metalloprotease [Streptomyces sp. HMX87]|uniref:M48 family metalloprotease n=1 Tax=Streptomyces sp. HMX87 TaxID=3390849 RepID=UPI003A8B4111
MTQPPPVPPEYPEPPTAEARPQYPQAAQAPTPAPPQYPEPNAQPHPLAGTPPQGAHPHTHAQAGIPPQAAHPHPQVPPQYPHPATPPPAPYPAAAPQPPAYPGATPTPAAAAPSAPPPYPQQTPHLHGVPTPPAPDDPAHPHHISTDRGRVHISAQQRRTDATAFGSLLLQLPNFLCSLVVVALLSLVFGDLGFLLVLAWLASGALVFHRPTESALARHLLRLRYPTPQERAKLEPVWREVTARAGVEGRNYELWVEDSDGLNAVAAAGHIVGVTRFAMNRLPNGELAAVLAHELGHHVGGHAWSGLLGYWYALPGRIAWRVLRAVTGFMFRVSRVFSCFGVLFFGLFVGAVALATISTLYGLPLLLLGVPYALAAVGRRAELRADQHAAALGFAPMLAAVLEKLHQQEQQQIAALTAQNGGVPVAESPVGKLLSSHPDHYTRLHHLQPYLQPRP